MFQCLVFSASSLPSLENVDQSVCDWLFVALVS